MRKKNTGGGISDEILGAEYEAVYRYVLSLCRDETLAQDITQETFLKAMKSYGGFAGESSLYTWLCAIAKNLWLNGRKKQGREVPAEDWEATLRDSGEPFEQNIADRDLTMYVHWALHTLNEPYKEVFGLRVFGELSFGDIARLFGKTESWARVTYHRAKKMVIEILRKGGYL